MNRLQGLSGTIWVRNISKWEIWFIMANTIFFGTLRLVWMSPLEIEYPPTTSQEDNYKVKKWNGKCIYTITPFRLFFFFDYWFLLYDVWSLIFDFGFWILDFGFYLFFGFWFWFYLFLFFTFFYQYDWIIVDNHEVYIYYSERDYDISLLQWCI